MDELGYKLIGSIVVADCTVVGLPVDFVKDFVGPSCLFYDVCYERFVLDLLAQISFYFGCNWLVVVVDFDWIVRRSIRSWFVDLMCKIC